MRQSGKKGSIVFTFDEFVDVSQRAVQRVYKQWCNTIGYELKCLNCGWKNSNPEGPHMIFTVLVMKLIAIPTTIGGCGYNTVIGMSST
ncbi:hypothetical protein CDAR_218351 [Caerostris darwini]|uniref:Uncharacterized protein n=1 Tax=Caerostris darwini TaxID=1538125 RepID=A0AAV4RAM5_9ARAC|nr:hypothetical protein CDAR_218351 [Caerostris darwini]